MKRQPRIRVPMVAVVGFVTVAVIAVILAVATNGSSDDDVSSPETVSAVEPDGSVVPDLDFRTALRSGGFSTRGWDTDFSRHLVPFSEIISGGPPKDGIPPHRQAEVHRRGAGRGMAGRSRARHLYGD